MPLSINEKLLRKYCLEHHGPTLGEIVFTVKLAELNKKLAEHERVLAQLEALEADRLALRSQLPRLEPLQQAMNDRYRDWLQACEALEAQRIKNEQAESMIGAKIADLESRRVEFFRAPIRTEWRELSPAEKASVDAQTWRPSLADLGEAALINRRR